MRHRSIHVLAILLCLSVGAARTSGVETARPLPAPVSAQDGCEPGTDLDLAARVLEIRSQGSTARVLIELVVSSRLESQGATLHGRRLAEGRAGAPVEALSLSVSGLARAGVRGPAGAGGLELDASAGMPRSLVVAVDLVHGSVHHLLFTLAADRPDEEPVQAQAYVSVPLDPDAAPETLEGLVQYRARSQP